MSYLGKMFSAVFTSTRVPVRQFPQMTSKIMASPFSTANLKVQHDKANKKFFVKMGSETAYINYALKQHGKNKVYDMYETNVPSSARGKGIGKFLADTVFKYIRHKDEKMILTCTFLQKLEKENPGRYTKHIYKA